jgi:hypothetical protein
MWRLLFFYKEKSLSEWEKISVFEFCFCVFTHPGPTGVTEADLPMAA